MRQAGGAAWVMIALAAAALLAPWVAPFAPDALDLVNRRATPSLSHWFGTDDLGRDLLSRVLFGARVSLAIGVLSAIVAGVIGVGVGAASGYAGGRLDAVLMRLTDAALSVPRLLLLMVASAVLTPSIPVLVVLVGLVGWMETARVTRAAFLGALSGSAMASVAMLGRFIYPTMVERGCDRKLSIGTILAGATLDPIIPPSVLAIILATLANVSIATFLVAGIGPGIFLAGLFAAYAVIRTILNPALDAPVEPRPESERGFWPVVSSLATLGNSAESGCRLGGPRLPERQLSHMESTTVTGSIQPAVDSRRRALLAGCAEIA